jgi:hypothetical protein
VWKAVLGGRSELRVGPVSAAGFLGLALPRSINRRNERLGMVRNQKYIASFSSFSEWFFFFSKLRNLLS